MTERLTDEEVLSRFPLLGEIAQSLDANQKLELKGVNEVENVKVFQLNENDGVAAESLEQAKEWYSEMTGLNDEDAYYDYEAVEMPLDYEIWEDETRKKKQSLQSVVVELWEGKPFLAFSSEY